MVIIKKLYLLIAALVLLVGCGDQTNNVNADEGEELTAHINIRDEIIGDSYQVMRIIDKAVDADEKPDNDVLFDYTDKYIDGYDNQNLTDEETELVMMTSLMVLRIDDYITVNSERRDFESDKEKWYETLETGKYQKDN